MIDSLLDASAAPLDRLRAMLLMDEARQQELAAIEDSEALAHAAAAMANARGIAISPTMLMAVLQPDPLGLNRFLPVAPDANAWPGRAWRPIGISPGAGGPVVEWAHFAGRPLVEPFFEISLRHARHRPFNRLMKLRTPLATFVECAPDDVKAPDGLIFHMSRCGSTLVAQMLTALRGTVVVSEPPPLDAIVQLAHTGHPTPEKTQVALLRAMAGALGRSVDPSDRLFLKLDSWHAMALPLFRRAFPDTPWIFLYRDPVAVLVSQHRHRGLQTVPGILPSQMLPIDPALASNAMDYCAAVLGQACAAAIDGFALGGGIAVEYATLPEAVETRILPHFGITPSAEERTALAVAARRDAKHPEIIFSMDADRKQAEASEEIRAAAARFMAGPCARLAELDARAS